MNSLMVAFDDLLFKDFFKTTSYFDSVFNVEKINYPVDIIQHKDSIEIQVAAVGLEKKDITIEVISNILKISYNKPPEKETNTYIYKGIANRSFNLGWKITNNKVDLSKIEASMTNGLLKIFIPILKEDENSLNFKKIQIK